MMRSQRLLQRWLVLVACLRLFSVYIGLFDLDKFKIGLFDLQPELVHPLYGRTFATWTTLTCALCLFCARDPTSPPIYGATLTSFVLALLHLGSETLYFKTISWRGGLTPMLIAGLTTLWMAAGWNYYTCYCRVEAAKAAAPEALKQNGEPVKKDL